MTFLPMTPREELGPEARAAADDAVERLGAPLTATQSALLSNLPSFAAYTQWQLLREELAPWIGERAVALFAHAISRADGCEQNALAFRKQLVDAGDDPDHPQVTEAEQLLIDWGRAIATDPHAVPDDMAAGIEAAFSPERRLTLLAFAGQLIALDVVTTAGRVPLDPALEVYRGGA